MGTQASQNRAFLVSAQGDLEGMLVIHCGLLLAYQANGDGDDIAFESRTVEPILAAPIGLEQQILAELFGMEATIPTKPKQLPYPIYRVLATSNWDKIDAFLRRIFTERATLVIPDEVYEQRPLEVQEKIEFYVRTIIAEMAKGEIAIDERSQGEEERRQQQETAAADGYRGVRITPVDWGPFGPDGPTI